jgi:sugar/nucleoside kinase (ribokinase family)
MTTPAWPSPPPAGSRPFDVVGLGECSADHLLVAGDYPACDSKQRLSRYELQGGGQIATALVACARLGRRSLYLGAVGDDQLGRWIVDDLEREGVDASRVVKVAGAPTRSAFIIVSGGGAGASGGADASRTILYQRDARLDVPASAFGDAPDLGRVLHLDATVPGASLAAARRARQAGSVVVLDIDHFDPGVGGLDELVAGCQVVIGSSGFARQLAGPGGDLERGLVRLGEMTRGFACCTAGAAGSLALIDGKVHHAPGFVVPVVDTTGAGDIYHAAFIHGLLSGWPPAEVMRFANAAAALKCRQLGGRPGAPTLAQVAELLA